MPRSSKATHLRILDAAYVLFRKKGFTRVNVDEIAAAAKITKRTLYSHFRSKDAMLAEVLEAQHQLALDAFHTFGNKLRGSARTIVRDVFQELMTWASSPRWSGSGFTRLVVELADLPGHPARSIAKKHKELLESHLSELLGRSGAKNPRVLAREIWLLFEGAMVLVLIHGDRSYLKAAEEAALKLLPKGLVGSNPIKARGRAQRPLWVRSGRRQILFVTSALPSKADIRHGGAGAGGFDAAEPLSQS